ncbi:lipopolysaccharide assembly LapA domain-containing protein [Paenarthrobacter aurescens]|uniref:Lipopolysaccharide assembly protein A domain-containing protein n=1 Tax=Paenarthrobacter aurescens TaxID=43663 RepID=A0A4Y3NCQ9_PAEAU|nr:LapA family protein [Paenarthrobacter aurescens]UKA50560.1 LapA family protein [Arthrobacter sp. FW305-123]MDO6142269.1 LapA family protein [Paenarthrobacter aurescens]MDO6146117.1 LapA family protein [Paenarthrobacter aurescens]MDO6157361.1 LapA family protein [Paenarthrobacter aurescens]MDO6161346.1 LapA family protein [Paenarthrobacter aurescens]
MSFQDDAARVPGSAARPDPGSSEHRERVTPPVSGHDRPTRTAALWVAVAVGLVVLVMLIVFFVQNQDMITVRFFGLEGTLALGTTLFIAAVGGGVLVALAGGARILQLRIAGHRRKKAVGGPGTGY